jgi:Tfp pilus assembly protein PilN
VEAQNVKYKQLEDALLSRINTIDALKSGRVGPVELMSSLGNVVDQTNDVYLYTVSPVGGRLQLKGQSGTVDSMATFLASLKNSGSFDDVQLEQFYEDDQHERLGYKFTLNCLFKSPTAGTTPAAGAAPAGPGGPVGQPSVPAQVQRGLKRGS